VCRRWMMASPPPSRVAAELVAVVTDAHAYCLHLSHVLSRTNASYDDRHDDDDDDDDGG